MHAASGTETQDLRLRNVMGRDVSARRKSAVDAHVWAVGGGRVMSTAL